MRGVRLFLLQIKMAQTCPKPLLISQILTPSGTVLIISMQRLDCIISTVDIMMRVLVGLLMGIVHRLSYQKAWVALDTTFLHTVKTRQLTAGILTVKLL